MNFNLLKKYSEASSLFASDRSLKVCYDRSLANKQLASEVKRWLVRYEKKTAEIRVGLYFEGNVLQ